MNRIALIIVSLAFCFIAMAQENVSTEPLALLKKGVKLQYSYAMKGKIMAYCTKEIYDFKEEGNKQTVSYLWKALNKKGKPSKSASMVGLGDGLVSSITLEDGAYIMTQDFILGSGGDNRQGFMLKLPKVLKVGDVIEGGTLSFTYSFMGRKNRNSITCSNFQVVSEENLTTPAGTFHCFKLTGNVSGEFQGMELDDNQIWYIAPGLGIIRQESNYMGAKRPYVAELFKAEGL